jgi:paired amphipathic helix protein Sin3a
MRRPNHLLWLRNLRLENRNLNEIYVRSQLQYKIDQDTYRMYYIDGSEDVFVRPDEKSTS